MDEQRQDDLLERTYISSVLIENVTLKIYRKRWTIEKSGGRGLRISVLAVQHDDDDDDDNSLPGHCVRLECSPMIRETGVQSKVESYQRLKKWYLVPSCLTLSIISYRSRVKGSNLGEGEAPSPIRWYCSYWKGSLQVTLDYFTYNFFNSPSRWRLGSFAMAWQLVKEKENLWT